LPTTSISDQSSPDSTSPKRGARAGGWLFKRRTALPLPLVVAILAIPSTQTRAVTATILAGLALTAIGELVRLWGVRHIGAVSRTRSDRLGPLVDTGPFAYVRNPLYLGNIALWTGFALTAALPWLAPIILLVLALVYHAIVRWEEGLLETRLGAAYRDYAARVPRWLPRPAARSGQALDQPFSWRDTLFSERGTLLAMAAGYFLLWLKARS
jgi:protein-S-isoprenylcysteine O-methyltransferase Ste14